MKNSGGGGGGGRFRRREVAWDLVVPERFLDSRRRLAEFVSQLPAGVTGAEPLGNLLGGDPSAHDDRSPEPHTRVQEDHLGLGLHRERRGVRIVTNEREESNGHAVDVLLDPFQVILDQLPKGKLAAPARVDQKAVAVDEYRNAIGVHVRRQQGMLAAELVLQIADHGPEVLRRYPAGAAKSPEHVKFDDVPERQQMTAWSGNMDQGSRVRLPNAQFCTVRRGILTYRATSSLVYEGSSRDLDRRTVASGRVAESSSTGLAPREDCATLLPVLGVPFGRTALALYRCAIAEYRPGFTCGMGCERAGKSAWRRANEDAVPARNFDRDAFADGMGGWHTQSARERTEAEVDSEIDEAFGERRDFGRAKRTIQGVSPKRTQGLVIPATASADESGQSTTRPDAHCQRSRTASATVTPCCASLRPRLI